MEDELLFMIDGARAVGVAPVNLSDLGLQERSHLQEWVLAHPDVLGSGVEVVTKEYDRWQTFAGDPVMDRLDVLGLDPGGRLVVAELKRDLAPHTVHMQAVNYAAMVSRLTPRDVAELWATYHASSDGPLDVEAALDKLETEKLLSAQSIRKPRIVLVANGFPASVTSAVVWLTECGVDIALVRYRAYRLGDGQLVAAFSRQFPVPDVEEFTIGRRVDQEDAAGTDPGPPWDKESLERLASQANPATITMLDLCAAEDASEVLMADIAETLGLKPAQVRAQLAWLTMRLRNPAYGFAQKAWPVNVGRLPDGTVVYSMAPALARMWREIQAQDDRTDS